MINIFAYAKINYGRSIETEYFSIDSDMSKIDIENHIKEIIHNFNCTLRPGENPREFVELTGWTPKIRIREREEWNDELERYETITLDEDNIQFEKKPYTETPVLSFH